MTSAFSRSAAVWVRDRSSPLKSVKKREIDYVAARRSLDSLFGTDRQHHSTRLPLSFLGSLLERQVTESLRNALNLDPEDLLPNCQALFDACTTP